MRMNKIITYILSGIAYNMAW